LVKNPSFEQKWSSIDAHCFDNIRYANYWSCIDTSFDTSYFGSPDIMGNPFCTPEYFNVCYSSSTPLICGVPYSYIGYQWPRTGNGYANVRMYDDSVYDGLPADSMIVALYNRDYLMGRLYHPLDSGRSYCVTFYVAPCWNDAFYVNHIGAYLDDGSIDTNSFCGLPHSQYTPQVFESEIITRDTTGGIHDSLGYVSNGWTQIQGSFIANGTEKYITIGNFFSRLNTDTIWQVSTVGLDNAYSYYEVDDVSVIASDAVAYAGNDTTINYGDSVNIGLDCAGNGGGMPCYWYILGGEGATTLIDSGGTINVKPTVPTTYVVSMNLCGHITTDTVTVKVWPEGVAGTRQVNLAIVYPNPATNLLTVDDAQGCVVRVCDVVGKEEIEVMSNDRRTNIDIKDLLSGIYFVEISNNVTGEHVVRKLVKE